MNFEEWYAKLGEWAEENTALNMSHAMQRHLARHLEEWEASRPTKRAPDAPNWVCRNCDAENPPVNTSCYHCGETARW